MKKSLLIIAIILSSCAASNKQHWQRIHPYGGWAGKNFIQPDSSQIKKIKHEH